MQFNRKKIAAATLMSAVAASAVVGGTLASFTDSSSATPQVLTAGTVDVALSDDGTWNQNLANLAIGDSATRTLNVTNNSTLSVKTGHLTAKVIDTVGQFGGKLSEATTVTISAENANGGLTPTVVADHVPLTTLATTGYDVNLKALPGSVTALTFTYNVVGTPGTDTGNRLAGAREATVNPDNLYQGSSVSVAYTLDEIQRDGANQVPFNPQPAVGAPLAMG